MCRKLLSHFNCAFSHRRSTSMCYILFVLYARQSAAVCVILPLLRGMCLQKNSNQCISEAELNWLLFSQYSESNGFERHLGFNCQFRILLTHIQMWKFVSQLTSQLRVRFMFFY